MSDLMVFDKYDNLLCILSNEAEKACPFWDAPFKDKLNNGSYFEFSAQGDHEDSRYLVTENQVAFKDKDEYFRLFVIKEIENTDGAKGPQIRCICEPAINELNEEIIEDLRPNNTTLQFALSVALNDTRWTVGITGDLGVNSTNFYYISVTEAINKIIATWGGEIRDRIEIQENQIVNRFVDILARRGSDTGKIWEIDKDILSLSNKVKSFPITALYGRGSSLETENGGFTRKITFADVVWSVANGDPVDKPAGQEWVGDPNALIEFGRKNVNNTLRHRKGIYENSNQDNPDLLLRETWDFLQTIKHPVGNYVMDVFLLEEITGHSHEKVRLGDTTIAIDRNFSKPLETEQRVIVYEYDVADPNNTGFVELGQYVELFSDEDRIKKLEAIINDKQGIWDNGGGAGGPISDSNIVNITPSQPENVSANGLFQSIIVSWDMDSSISIANYEVYASRINNFTPDQSNLVFRGKTSAYEFKGVTNQQWYFRVRAVNPHNVPGPYSPQVSASTVRLITEDILFGAITSDLLDDLSVTAGKLADGSVDFDKLEQSVVDEIETLSDTVSSHTTQITQNTNNIALKANQTTVNTLANRVTSAEGSITTMSGQIALKASQTSVDTLTGRVSTAEGSITTLSNNIALKVDKNGIVAAINISPETVRIDAKFIRLSGTSLIDNAVIKTVAIADAAITNAKLDRASVNKIIIGTADIADAAITNAKIGNVSADKITAASLSAITSNLGDITAGSLNINNNFIVNLNGHLTAKSGVIGGLTVTSTKMYMGDSGISANTSEYAFWAGETNGHLGASTTNAKFKVGHNGVLHAIDALIYGTIHATGGSFSGDITSTGVITGGTIRTANTTNYWDTNFTNRAEITNGRLLFQSKTILSTYAEVEIDGSGITIRGDNNFYGIPDEVKTNNYVEYGSNGLYASPKSGNPSTYYIHADRVLLGTGTPYLQVWGDLYNTFLASRRYTLNLLTDDVLKVANLANNAFRPVYASAFTVNSQASYKQDIELFNESALQIIANSDIYQYRLKDDVLNGIDKLRVGLVIGEGYNTPERFIEGGGISQYDMSSIAFKAIQELNNKQHNLADRVNLLEIENQYLKARIKNLEEAVA